MIRTIRIRHSLSDCAALQITPVVGTGPVADELLAQMYRVVAVDEHERLAGSKRVEAGENHRVPLGFGNLAHVQLAGVSGCMRIVVKGHNTYYSYK